MHKICGGYLYREGYGEIIGLNPKPHWTKQTYPIKKAPLIEGDFLRPIINYSFSVTEEEWREFTQSFLRDYGEKHMGRLAIFHSDREKLEKDPSAYIFGLDKMLQAYYGSKPYVENGITFNETYQYLYDYIPYRIGYASKINIYVKDTCFDPETKIYLVSFHFSHGENEVRSTHHVTTYPEAYHDDAKRRNTEKIPRQGRLVKRIKEAKNFEEKFWTLTDTYLTSERTLCLTFPTYIDVIEKDIEQSRMLGDIFMEHVFIYALASTYFNVSKN